MADEEPVKNSEQDLEDTCKLECVQPLQAYQACAEKIKGDENGRRHCIGLYLDYRFCIGDCIASKLVGKQE